MRWHIIRTLLRKEVQRNVAQRGSLALAGLLVAAAILLTMIGKKGGTGAALTGGSECCFIDYWREDDWLRHLRQNVPAEFQGHIKFRDVNLVARPGELLVYPAGSGAIQMRLVPGNGARPNIRISVWRPAPGSLAAFEVWFWRESARFFRQKGADAIYPDQRNEIEYEQANLKGGVEVRVSVASALVLFGLFFCCVYLMPSLMCEERERGLLLAQALSPASAWDILAAKCLFYPLVGLALGAILAGIAKPQVLAVPFFWLALMVAGSGSLGVGLTIASLAKSQRAASMGALGYMLVVTLFLFICQLGKMPGLSCLALEYHNPRILHAALTDSVQWFHWLHLGGAGVLAICWLGLAAHLFRKRGWQ